MAVLLYYEDYEGTQYPLIDTPIHIGYASPVRAGPARQNLSNPARVERQQR